MIYSKDDFNLVYMAKPMYGGWVSFTAHLSLKYNLPLFRITKRDEKSCRSLGYGCPYKNQCISTISKIPNLLITAIDKNYYKYLDNIPDGSYIVIHDPTEYTGKSKSILREHLKRFNIVTIREKVKANLLDKYNLKSIFVHHPFYEFDLEYFPSKLKGSISISRIDYDKNTDIIVKANDELEDPCEIYGFPNDLYVYRKLSKTNFNDYYKGRFSKSFNVVQELLCNKKFVVDMSSIKNDGDGSQYTFLEAIYLDCILILNSKWVSEASIFKNGTNCLVVGNSEELKQVLNSKIENHILENSKKLLIPHIEVNWRLDNLHLKFLDITKNKIIDS